MEGPQKNMLHRMDCSPVAISPCENVSIFHLSGKKSTHERRILVFILYTHHAVIGPPCIAAIGLFSVSCVRRSNLGEINKTWLFLFPALLNGR